MTMSIACRTLLACLVMAGTGTAVAQTREAIVHATLTLGDAGHLRVVMRNEGQEPIRFLDAREGAAASGSIWRIELRLDDGTVVNPALWYSPGDPPHVVTLAPGTRYERVLQAAAYLEQPPRVEGRATAIVHYAVQGRLREWIGLAPKELRFATPPLDLDLSSLFGAAADANTNRTE